MDKNQDRSKTPQDIDDTPSYTVTIRGSDLEPSYHAFSSREDAERFADEFSKHLSGGFILIEDSEGRGTLWELDTACRATEPPRLTTAALG